MFQANTEKFLTHNLTSKKMDCKFKEPLPLTLGGQPRFYWGGEGLEPTVKVCEKNVSIKRLAEQRVLRSCIINGDSGRQSPQSPEAVGLGAIPPITEQLL